MRSLYSFIVKPKYDLRYQNTKKIQDVNLILNTEMSNHNFVNRIGEVVETPINGTTGIKKGDDVLLHHNVFRRFYDISGKEKNSRSYFDENQFFAEEDQIYMYRRKDSWKPLEGYCFVKPIQNSDNLSLAKKERNIGVVKYIDNSLQKNGIKLNDLVGFTPYSEFEFEIDNEILYRVKASSMCIKYEHKGDKKEYSPSWL
jgi:hypothetical protein